MTISESNRAIHLGGLSNRILSKNWYYVFRILPNYGFSKYETILVFLVENI